MTRHRCIAPLLLTLVLLTAGCGDEPARPIAQGEAAATLTIDYPIDLSVFPPDLVAPRLRWKDATEGVNAWLVVVEPEDGEALLREVVPGEPPPIGVIDPACIARTNSLPARPGPFERSWRIPDELWAQVKQGTHQRWAKITVTGFDQAAPTQALSRGWVRMKTSADPVGAPIFYRDVPLAPAKTAKGKIQPLPGDAVPLIKWHLRDVSLPRSRVVLEGMPTCANCHSFSKDGSTFGMDVDGPTGDKGTYAVLEVAKRMVIDYENIFTWNAFPEKPEDHHTLGFLSRVSPNGRYVVSTVNEALYVANYSNYEFLQVFFPTRGILAWYDRETEAMRALPGADDPEFVHCDPVWTPDGKELVFARAPAREPYPEGYVAPKYPNDPNETKIQYDLYRLRFDEGRGGKPEPILGASANGKSNTFPKVSPDGKWIVFVKCRNGQLMRPDGRLWIVPFEGGEAREMQCNTWRMNSWHSFSPNGRWMVFSSKANTPYTQMFLTHIDEDGNDSPPILIPHATAANRAVNIPEFLNAPYDALQSIEVPGVRHRRSIRAASELMEEGQIENALAIFEDAVKTNPRSADAWLNLGWALGGVGRHEEAVRALEKAVDIEPTQALAHNNLAYELMQLQGDEATLRRALAHLRQARKLDPSLTPAQENFALALFRIGDDEEAYEAYLQLVQREPGNAEAHGALGTLSLRRGRFEQAVAHLERAVEAGPDDLELVNSLAWQRATAPVAGVRDGKRALTLAERLVEQSQQRSASFLDTLAAAYAEAGRFEDAVGAAKKALEQAQDETLAAKIRSRLGLYAQRQPYRQPGGE